MLVDSIKLSSHFSFLSFFLSSADSLVGSRFVLPSFVPMFSANSQLTLRKKKREVIGWVDSHLPSVAVDGGVTVLAMEVQCKAIGCVPIETVIVIVFPSDNSWNEGGVIDEELASSGKYQTKILKPMLEVTEEDVTASLPPSLGGTFDPVNECVDVRDLALARIDQLMYTREDKMLAVKFLMASLREYACNGFELPEPGAKYDGDAKDRMAEMEISDFFGIADAKDVGGDAGVDIDVDDIDGDTDVAAAEAKHVAPPPNGNFVIKRSKSKSSIVVAGSSEVVERSPRNSSLPKEEERTERNPLFSRRTMEATNRMMDKQMSSGDILAQMMQREHAPGVRVRGCPCCDPDDPSNVIDRMLMP